MKKTIAVLATSASLVGLLAWSVSTKKSTPFLPVVHADSPPRPTSLQAQAVNQNIVGTWIITVTVNTPPGAPPFVFTDMIAFNSGGTLTAASSTFNAHTSENPFLPPPLVVDTSDGYGAWKPVGNDSNQFALTFKRFLFAGANTSTAVYGSFFPGQYVGVNTVQAVGNHHTGEGGDTLSGAFTNQFVNLGGQVVFAGSGTFSATRLEIEPLAAP